MRDGAPPKRGWPEGPLTPSLPKCSGSQFRCRVRLGSRGKFGLGRVAHKPSKILGRELPFEGRSDPLVALLGGEQALSAFVERSEVVRSADCWTMEK